MGNVNSSEITDKKKWIVDSISSAKNGKLKKMVEVFKECDLHTRIAVVQEIAYMPVNERVTTLMVYASQRDPESVVKKSAQNILNARMPLRFSVLRASAGNIS